jgi:putative mRNA 3-end processing factor
VPRVVRAGLPHSAAICLASRYVQRVVPKNDAVAAATGGGALGVERRAAGAYIAGLDLYLDPETQVAAAFVSHAHGARAAAESALVLASKETLALTNAAHGAVIEPGVTIEQPIAEAWGGGVARLSVAPSGHVPGAMQLVVDHPRGRLVYAGDWRGGDVVACDELAVATAFALPIFRFPTRERVLADIVAWCRARIDEKRTPVVLADPLGAAPAIERALADSGVTGVVVAAATAKATELRARRGVVAFASPWAVLDAAVEQRRADAAFAYSDHADFDELLAMVGATGARVVHAVYGDAAPFAHVLRGRGIDAHAIEGAAIDAREP